MRIRTITIAALGLLALAVAVTTAAAAAVYAASESVVMSTAQARGPAIALVPWAHAAGNLLFDGVRALGAPSEPVGLVLLASVLMVVGRVARGRLKLQADSE